MAKPIQIWGRKPFDVVPEEYLESFRTDLKNLVAFLQQHGLYVILSTYPFLINERTIDAHREIILNNRKFFPQLSLKGMIDSAHKFNAVIKAVADQNNVSLVDNYGMLPQNLTYFADNVHYTNQGARLVAKNFSDIFSR